MAAAGNGFLRRRGWRMPAALGLLVVGLFILLSAVSRRMAQDVPPPPPPQQQGYLGLVPDVAPVSTQRVVVTTIDLHPGDPIDQELLERRPASAVATQFPNLRSKASLSDPQAPILEGYYTQVEEAQGQYALSDLPAGSPLGPLNASDSSPLAAPIDALRQDRAALPMPAEPTLFPLLRPGDRLDVYFILPGQVTYRAINNVRVVGINDYLTKGSGVISKDEERWLFSTKAQAARRKREWLLQQQAKQRGGQAPPPEPAKADQQAASQPGGNAERGGADANAKPGGSEPLDGTGTDGVIKVASKEFSGRVITVQVSQAEAMMLATAECSTKIAMDFALHRRR